MKKSYVDLFCGAGGLGEGFQQAQFEPMYINDIDISAIKTCQLRKSYHKLLELNRVDSYYDFIESSNKTKPSFYDPTEFIRDDDALSYIIDKISSSEEMNKNNISSHYKQIKANLDEIKLTYATAKQNGCKEIILLYCVSSYPASEKDINLNNIKKLKKIFNCKVGFSDHTNDLNIASAAIAAGAEFIEKHIALENQKKGLDI